MGVQGCTKVYSSVGGDAILHCSNVVYPNCSSTVWYEWSSRVKLILYGKINPYVDTHGAKRLSLLSDCSLHITDVTTNDAGLYLCRQYLRVGGPQHGGSAFVYLHVLQVSASPSQTEMEADSHVTLHCILHTPHYYRRYSLSWVDETGKELQNSTNHKTSTSRTSSITLTEELRGPNPVHTLTCQVTEGGQVQTSVSHTIRVKDSYSSPHSSVVHVAVKVATTISLFVAVIIVEVICRTRSGDPHGKPNTSMQLVPDSSSPKSTSITCTGATGYQAGRLQ